MMKKRNLATDPHEPTWNIIVRLVVMALFSISSGVHNPITTLIE